MKIPFELEREIFDDTYLNRKNYLQYPITFYFESQPLKFSINKDQLKEMQRRKIKENQSKKGQLFKIKQEIDNKSKSNFRPRTGFNQNFGSQIKEDQTISKKINSPKYNPQQIKLEKKQIKLRVINFCLDGNQNELEQVNSKKKSNQQKDKPFKLQSIKETESLKNSKIFNSINIDQQKRKNFINQILVQMYKENQLIQILNQQPQKKVQQDKTEKQEGKMLKIQQKETIYKEFSHPTTIQKIENNLSKHHKIKNQKLQRLKFSLCDNYGDKFYNRKLNEFKQFIFKINYSNRMFINLDFNQDQTGKAKYKVYVGSGNNCNLVKGLFARRFYIQIVDQYDEKVHFCWTQLKMDQLFAKQQCVKHQQKIKKYSPFMKHMILSQNCQQKKIMHDQDIKQIEIEMNKRKDKHIYRKDLCINYEYIYNIIKKSVVKYDSQTLTVHNHLQNNFCLNNKKALFHYLINYCQKRKIQPFKIIPLTFHIKSTSDKSFKQFSKIFKYNQNKKIVNLWIVKPGQVTNRGNGIFIMKRLSDLLKKLAKQQRHYNGQLKTFIVQQYIKKPLLYHGRYYFLNRKFDIRHFMMITSMNGNLKGYWYKDGYIRTSSYIYDIVDLNPLIHLTNDAIQKQGNYGQYQSGNKISYSQFQKYLDNYVTKHKINFFKEIIPQMKNIALKTIEATCLSIDKNKRAHNFQVFGLDFMIDTNFKVWLIQVNSNPCLQISCPVLERIIPQMIEHSLRVGFDPLFPPPCDFPNTQKHLLSDKILANLKYQGFFDSFHLKKIEQFKCDDNVGYLVQQTCVYESDGEQVCMIDY